VGDRLAETQAINKSLSALGDVFQARAPRTRTRARAEVGCIGRLAGRRRALELYWAPRKHP
jgi:hypothetical protein